MSEVRLSVEPRTEFGKGAARRTRRAGKIPAVLYGHGTDPRHLALPALEFARVIRENGSNAVLTLDVDSASELALTKTYQRSSLVPAGAKPPDARYFAVALEKRLSAEQLLLSTVSATGADPKSADALRAKFVKAFSSVGSALMVDPRLPSKPSMFICGNDAGAKDETRRILDQFGWATEDIFSHS